MAKITIHMPSGEELKFGLDLEKISVGRVEGNDIVIDDVSMSSHHATLSRQENGNFLLTDLDSTNGTRVAGEVIAEAYLEDGAAVQFGNVTALYESEVPKGERVALPEEVREEAQVGESSGRPTNFSNEQPFQAKKKQKDPIATLLVSLAVVALLACIASVVASLGMKGI